MTVVGELLRWIWWGLIYLAVFLTAVLVIFVDVPATLPVKLALLTAFMYGIALDARRVWRSTDRDRPRRPDGGDLARDGAS